MASKKLVLLSEHGVTLSKVTLAETGSSDARSGYIVESKRTPDDVRSFAKRTTALDYYEEEVTRCRLVT